MTSVTTTSSTLTRVQDRALRDRAATVIPGGMYGHVNVVGWSLPSNYPQFFSRSEGDRLWDVDGQSYVDMLCSWGPILLGYADPTVDAAAREQAQQLDAANGTSARMVELAELLVDTVSAADWAMFAKNGNDATTTCCTIARAATGRRKILKAKAAYHGASPAFTPVLGGITPEDRANLIEVTYNDIASFEAAAAEHDGDVAAVILTPFQHDGHVDQELADPAFARAVRELCDRIGAVLILDEVRTGFRLDIRGSWEPLGVRPDLSAFSKALGNGHAISAVTGTDALRDAVGSIFVTGSFWYSAVSMAAAIATITKARDTDVIETMRLRGEQLRAGIATQAATHGVAVSQTGPVQLPLILFPDDDEDLTLGQAFVGAALEGGAYLHPWHNMFLSGAHTEESINQVLAATDLGFTAVRRALERR